ncbi:MAG TPA: TolC family protein [Chitinophagaceae bacterium]|nr:TolC family protein [Chitinophagaceae bacterium]
MRNSKTIFILLLSLLSLSVYAQQADSGQVHYFTAKQAVDYALKNATQVKNALLDIESQKQTNKQVTASALPQVTGDISLTDYLALPTSLLPAEFFGGPSGTYVPIKFGTKYNGTYSGDFQQIIFDGQVFVGLQARKTSIDFYTKEKEVTEEQIKTNVYKIYYQLVVGKRQIGTIDVNISNYEKLLHDTKEIYKNGFAEKLDVDKVQVQLANLYTQRLGAQNQINAGLEGLKFLMHVPQKDSLVLTDTLSDDEIKSNILDENYNYEDRKDFQLLGLESKLQAYNIKRYRLSKIPTLTFDANIAQNAQRTTFNFFKKGEPYFTTTFISFRLAVPIFSGGAKNAQIALAKLDWEKTQNNIDQLKASIDNDVAQARLNMKSAITTMDSQKKNIELAESVYNSTKLKYEQGVGSNQEINQAEADLVTAQNNYYQSIYDAIIAKINYLQATGKL